MARNNHNFETGGQATDGQPQTPETAGIQLAEGLEKDPRLATIREELTKGWQARTGKDILSEEGQNFLFGDPSAYRRRERPVSLDERAKILFQERFPEDAGVYAAKERVRIYEDPRSDPVIQKFEQEAVRLTNRNIVEAQKGVWGKEKQKEASGLGYGRAWDSEYVAQNIHGWDGFVERYPEKATAYREKLEPIRKALERNEQRQKDEGSDRKAENRREKSPEERITETLGELNSIDRKIFEARKSIAVAEQKLSALREDIGVSSASEGSPAADFQRERLRKLEEERQELAKEKQAWIEENGRENLPEGMALESGEDGREARAGSPEEERDLTDKEKREEEGRKQEDLEARKEWLKKWEEVAVRDFEKAMRDDWWTNDAANLELTIELMKMRVPKAMDKKAEDFVNGKIDEPPFSTVWIRWETFGLLDLILGKPNQIKKLEITFDEDREGIAKEEELVDQKAKEDIEEDAEKNDQPPNISQNPAANKTEGNESADRGAAA